MVDLTELENQTKKLKTLGEMILKEHKDFVEYAPKNGGTFIGFGLHREKSVAVQRVFMSKGTKIERHSHPEQEYVIVYKGKVSITREHQQSVLIDGKVQKASPNMILGPADGIHFFANEWHEGEVIEDCWVISMTIPAGEGYPDA